MSCLYLLQLGVKLRLTPISFCQKLHVERSGYVVKFQEAVQSSNAVFSAWCLQNFQAAIAWNEVRHKEVAE